MDYFGLVPNKITELIRYRKQLDQSNPLLYQNVRNLNGEHYFVLNGKLDINIQNVLESKHTHREKISIPGFPTSDIDRKM